MDDNVPGELKRHAKIIADNGEEITIDIDDLKMIKTLGHGQYGHVTKRLHTKTGTCYAVKRIDIATDYYRQQSQIMDLYVPMRINSRNSSCLVKYYGAICAEGSIWIINEIMDASLDRFCQRAHEMFGGIHENFISKVAFAVLDAVQHLKQINIMHRDIKPSNVLINRNGEIKLCDFGVSGVLVNSTCETRQKGCRLYMAPEKLDPDSTDRYNVKADIWSLGISLIEIATNGHPYEDTNGYFAISGLVVNGETPPTLPTGFSAEFSAFVTNCLIKDPNMRATIQDLLSSLFIFKYSNENVDLNMIGTVLNSTDKDIID